MKRNNPFALNPNTKIILRQIGVGFLVLSVVASIIAGVWYGSRAASFTIDSVQVASGETINPELVKQQVETELEGTYFGLIPKRFSLFYPQKAALAAVMEIERVKDVTISETDQKTLKVSFSEHKPHSLWCKTTLGADCLFLNSEGYAFGVAPDLSGGSFMRFITTGREPQLKETLVPSTLQYNNFFDLIDRLSFVGWFVSSIEIDQIGDAFVTIVEGGELKITLAASPSELVDNLRVVLSSPEFSSIAPGSFEYIDLRFGDKVFVQKEDEDFATTTDSMEAALQEIGAQLDE